MNDDELTPGERTQLRAAIVDGASSVRSARTRRTAFLGGALALVIVGGISGGAIAAAAYIGSITAAQAPTPTITATPTLTPTPTPTSTVTPTPTPTVNPMGTTPFGGECANVLSEEETAAATGMPMVRSDYRWRTGADDLAGGIDCLWISSEWYMAAVVSVLAFPDAVVTQTSRDAAEAGCMIPEREEQYTVCTVSGSVDGTWLMVRVRVIENAAVIETAEDLYRQVAARLTEHVPPAPAVRSSEWWAPLDCNRARDAVDPQSHGFDVMEVSGDSRAGFHADPLDVPFLAGLESGCVLTFARGEGESVEHWGVVVNVVPGGAVALNSILGYEGRVDVDVPGASAAFRMPGLDRFEGSWSHLVVTDGVNILMLIDGDRRPEQLPALAADVLGMLEE